MRRPAAISVEQAKATLEMLREMKETSAGRAPDAVASDKAAIDAARNAFFARGSGESTVPVEKVVKKVAEKPAEQKSNVVEMGAGKRTPSAAPVENNGEMPATRKSIDGVAGFKRTWSKQNEGGRRWGAPDAGKSAVAAKVQQVEGTIVARADAGPRKKFSQLNAHEKLERRAEFFGNLRESAGFTRDGKQAALSGPRRPSGRESNVKDTGSADHAKARGRDDAVDERQRSRLSLAFARP